VIPDDHAKFAHHYVVGGQLDARGAAIEAGFPLTNAEYRARQLLEEPPVQRLIELLEAALAPASEDDEPPVPALLNEITPVEVVRHMAAILRADPIRLVKQAPENGHLIFCDLDELDSETRLAIKRLKLMKDGSVQAEFYDKMRVIEGLANRYNLFRRAPLRFASAENESAVEVTPPPAKVEGLADAASNIEDIYDQDVTFRETVREMVFGHRGPA